MQELHEEKMTALWTYFLVATRTLDTNLWVTKCTISQTKQGIIFMLLFILTEHISRGSMHLVKNMTFFTPEFIFKYYILSTRIFLTWKQSME